MTENHVDSLPRLRYDVSSVAPVGHYEGQTVHRSFNNRARALALPLSAACATSVSFAASLIAAGWSPGAAVAGRVAIAAVVLTVPALFRLRSHRVSWTSARTLLIYGVLAVA